MRRAVFAGLLLIVACTSTTAPNVGEEFQLLVGQQVSIPAENLWLRFLGVDSDSRCPSDVTCVWEGDGAVLIEVAPLVGDAKTDTLHTTLEPKAIELGLLELALIRLDPYPSTQAPIEPDQYVVTLTVRETGS
jgi:hypothetical protein